MIYDMNSYINFNASNLKELKLIKTGKENLEKDFTRVWYYRNMN